VTGNNTGIDRSPGPLFPSDLPVIPGLADSHFHSTAMAERGLDPAEILIELRRHNAGPMVDVAIQPEDAARQRELTGMVPDIRYTMGLHPGSSGREDWQYALELIAGELATGRYHAVGETGLDWYRMYAPRERQSVIFEEHLRLANTFHLPVIIHNREADEDCLSLLRANPPAAGGVMHCYSGDPRRVQSFLDLGMYISFAGNVTFRKADTLREAAGMVPEDRLLVETDAPFLTPHPYRGRLNHPGFAGFTLAVLAEVRGVTPEHLAEATSANLRSLFGEV
jgi:TatD DNase family protein